MNEIYQDEMIGQRFGMLLIVAEADPRKDARGHIIRQLKCRCDCGKETILNYNNIKCGLIQSCGCTRFPKRVPVDLTGKKFGMLTVLSEVSPHVLPSGDKIRQWLCRCDCGKERIILQSNLTSQRGTRSCGCITRVYSKRKGQKTNITGNRYGRLVVIEPAEAHRRTNGTLRRHWKCRCDCGNTVNVAEDNLLFGHTRSCGCMKRTGLKKQIFGYLTVISKKKNSRDWICKCICGNMITVSQDDLFWGTITSCGCKKKSTVDITGQRFGRLTAIRETEPIPDKTGKLLRCWLCRCDCGKEIVVRMKNLKNQNTRSCGCIRSDAAKKSRAYSLRSLYQANRDSL